jgi:uncharacterized protein
VSQFDAFNRRDLEAIRALHHDDVRVDWSASRELESGVYAGLSEVVGFFRTFFDMFDAVRVEPEEFIESGELIVVPNCAHMRGRDGIETIARSALVFEVRGSRVASLRLYQETSDALRAVDPPRSRRPGLRSVSSRQDCRPLYGGLLFSGMWCSRLRR